MDNLRDHLEWLKKEAERNRLQKEISKIAKRVNEAGLIQQNLKNLDMQISDADRQWDNKLSSFNSSIMAPIVVEGKFEGESAEIIRKKVPEPISKMDSTKAEAEGTQGEVGEQLNKLTIYIGKLEDKKAVLVAQLAAV